MKDTKIASDVLWKSHLRVVETSGESWDFITGGAILQCQKVPIQAVLGNQIFVSPLIRAQPELKPTLVTDSDLNGYFDQLYFKKETFIFLY